ncbi:hypothetical protein PVK06_038286 [Gossypium arboreum]|uniref:CP12 domain-containing protein n=1 Tax=Gossypium arboreum TaxID=29729 RepID=A0ABR0MZQ2_GOSAR|nr:hypothetical protein PVK06_038286 [Gossypium arboreum]
MQVMKPVRAAPDSISEKVEKSVKEVQEACSDDPVSGECIAAWDEVKELSAAASHARDKKKDNDPLENYCKDNPKTDECRTYDNGSIIYIMTLLSFMHPGFSSCTNLQLLLLGIFISILIQRATLKALKNIK